MIIKKNRLHSITILCVILISLMLSCAQNEDYENPFDPRNKRTAGSPPGLVLQPGDKKVVVSWPDWQLEGVTKYK